MHINKMKEEHVDTGPYQMRKVNSNSSLVQSDNLSRASKLLIQDQAKQPTMSTDLQSKNILPINSYIFI